MAANYTVSTKILRPATDVFNAVVSGEKLTRYFANATSGDLVEGQKVQWRWNEWGDFPVVVKKIVRNELIELSLNSNDWHKTENAGYDVQIIFKFETLSSGETMLSVSEHGWQTDAEGLVASHQNCAGWMHMLMCLKAYTEHNIDMR